MKKIAVTSLGGSLIIPKEVNYAFLAKFRKTLRKHYKTHKFVVVCGGGSIARTYISGLERQGKSIKQQSLAGIRATRVNAKFMMQFFGEEANDSLPENMKEVKALLAKNKVVFCGALRYAPKETTDGTAAKLAKYLKTDFINISDMPCLYTSNPKTNKDAKPISAISWKDFEKKARGIKYKPGQHYILDQNASKIIRRYKIKTYLIGPKLKNLTKILKNKPFKGTIIQG